MKTSRLLCAFGATAALAAGASTASGAPALHRTAGVRAGRVTVPDAAVTVPAGAKVLGAATDSVDVLVGLRHRDQEGLDTFVKLVSDPESPAYQQYLSPAEFRARYAAPDSSVDAVRAFASDYGLTVADVPRNHLYVELTGSAANAARAFGTALKAVQVDGRTAHLPAGTPSVPESLAPIVTSVEGLDTSRLMHPDALTYPDAFVNAGPCSTSFGEKVATDVPGALGADHLPYAPCGYTPQQLRSAYGLTDVVKRGIDGTGVKVGIIDAFDYPHALEDANTYAGKRGEPNLAEYVDHSPAGLSAVPEAPGGLLLDPNGWAGEQQLDVEAVHAIAPGAGIHYYGATTPLNAAFTMTQNQVVDDAVVQIVSNSYGGAADSADANTEAVLQQAAATGIGFYFSSGDQGDETKNASGDGSRQTDSSANQPMATAVGGTSLGVGANGEYQFETGWGTYSATLTGGAFGEPTFNSGGGGGTSEVYGQPAYQVGVVPSAIANYFSNHPDQAIETTPLIPGRAVPDVSMVADPNTGMLIGQQQEFGLAGSPVPVSPKYSEYRIGGTSLSSPLFAGVMALADQAAGKAHGFANPALYALSGSGAFHDVVDPPSRKGVIRRNFTNSVDETGGTDTFLRTLNDTNTIHTIPGFDDVTGLGSPQGVQLLHALAPANATLTGLATPAATPTPTPTASATATPTAGPVGSLCKPKTRVSIRLRHHKRDFIRKAVIRLQGHKRRVLKGKNVIKAIVKTPKRLRTLTIITTTKSRLRTTTVRHVNACGLRGKATAKTKQLHRPKH